MSHTVRLYFCESYVDRRRPGVETSYLGGHFYHVDDELAKLVTGSGIALTEEEKERKDNREAAAAAAAAVSAEDLDAAVAEQALREKPAAKE